MDRARYMRPSGAGSWSACVGYAALNASLDVEYTEEPDNEVREDGTAWHWLAEQVWNGSRPSVGSLSPNNREITEEMYVGVEEYHEMLHAWGTPVQLEQKVPVATHFPGVADGTADAVGIDHAALLLNIGDGKYGGSGQENLGDGWGAQLGGEISRKLHLHARSIGFDHPVTGKRITVTAPLPEHMARTWKTLGWHENDVPADPFEDLT